MTTLEPRAAAELPDPNDPELFPRFDEGQLAVIAAHARERTFAAGETIFDKGARNSPLQVLLEGAADVYDVAFKGERYIARALAGTYVGDTAMFTGEPTYVACRAAVDCRTLEVSREELRRLVGDAPEIGDLILGTMTARRAWLDGHGYGIVRLIGSSESSRAFELRSFLSRNHVPHRWLDPDEDPQTRALLRVLGVCIEELPVLVAPHKVMRNPTIDQIARKLGLRRDLGCDPFDVAIVGAGPGGLAAGVYAASEGLRTLLVDAGVPGGQAGTSSRIENYLGFPTGISGEELAERAIMQAQRFGVELSSPHSLAGLAPDGDRGYLLELDDGQRIGAGAVVLATGAQYRRLGVPGEDELRGAGVYSAATRVELADCGDRDVVIVGGGNSAGQAAVFAAAHAARVHLVVRRDSLAATMSAYLIERIASAGNVELLTGTTIAAIIGERRVRAVRVAGPDGREREIAAHAVFVMIGAEPCTDAVAQVVGLDDRGYVVTGAVARAHPRFAEHWGLERAPLPLETTRPRVFAVGDVRSGSAKRVATAVGDGAMAVRLLSEATPPA